MKNQKGITLIALVITIIVLLILAGISIAALSGDNGLLNRAKQAETDSQKGNLEEAVKLAVAQNFIDNLGTFTSSDLDVAAIKKQNDQLRSITKEDSSTYISFTDTENNVTVYVGKTTGKVATSSENLS